MYIEKVIHEKFNLSAGAPNKKFIGFYICIPRAFGKASLHSKRIYSFRQFIFFLNLTFFLILANKILHSSNKNTPSPHISTPLIYVYHYYIYRYLGVCVCTYMFTQKKNNLRQFAFYWTSFHFCCAVINFVRQFLNLFNFLMFTLKKSVHFYVLEKRKEEEVNGDEIEDIICI